MGKRLRRGGRSPFSASSIMSRSILIRRIKTLNINSSPDPDIVIQRLRDQYPDYARIKLQPFSARLNQVLHYIRDGNAKAPTAGNTSSSSFSDGERPSRRKRGKENVFEERLLRSESEHLRRLQVKDVAPSSLSESADDSTSTSDDAAFEESIEPEFDVTKSMLRDRYVKQSVQSVNNRKEEKNVEIEAVEIPMKMGEKEAPLVGLGVVGSDHRSDMVSGETGRDGPRFQDLGGMDMVLKDLMMEVIVPLCLPEVPKMLGVKPITGILLHGPPGCGKTKLAYAIANETGVPLYKICATEVVSGVSGASEESIRDLFNKAYRTAPSIVFIDEIDAISSKREDLQRGMERRIVTELMNCMDASEKIMRAIDSDSGPEASKQITNRKSGFVLVIGATNRPDAIDQALRRPGRFDREIALGVPNENARAQILSVLIRNLKIKGEFDCFRIARITSGFVGADLTALVNKAGNLAIERIMNKRMSQLKENVDWWRHPLSPEEIEELSITMFDFEEAAKLVQPSTRREGFSSIPNIKWEDVGGLDSLRKDFNRFIIDYIKHPEDYEKLGVDMDFGFMLYGPPGCGKSLIARAVANEAGANFIHIQGPEILKKYVGESEQEIRTIFRRARTCSPCIIFFDEVDALAPKGGKEGAWVVEQVLDQLLVELSGGNQRHGVYVIGATNRPEAINPAILRPGRFGKLYYVPLPNADEQALILKALARKKSVSPDFDYNAFTSREACKNLSGADLAALMNEAAMIVIKEKQMHVDQGISYDEPLMIKTSHFEKALEHTIPSVSKEQRRYYEALSQNFRVA